MNPVDIALKENKSIHEATFKFEKKRGTKNIREEMQRRIEVMSRAAEKGISETVKTKSGMVRGNAKKFFENYPNFPLTSKIVSDAIAFSLAISEVNASMGLVVAAPTAGSCGVVPGALLALHKNSNEKDVKLVDAFLTASGIGLLIAERATFSAAVAGCGAEVGASVSMVSAAITEYMGGTAEQAVSASAISLKSYLGLACDPVAGLVEVPCIKRNAIGVANAFAASQMALCGIESAIPFNEVVDAMYSIGKRLPYELRETSKGGLAVSETALRISGKLYNVI